ncbi:MAG: FHA domain-containing protein [Acidimicrobiia bacterium]|nr:FHA domain-containing protein [Acidimicrobiia bacterium]MDH4364850.1 FHA domain-containing protein [Acidimicrobiia bacterium]MDH5290102.1 FHA domain-containing protein [Acidimicrobiia bacterium]
MTTVTASPNRTGALIAVSQDGRTPLHVVVVDRLDVGRECDGLLLADQRVSRLHLRLELVEGRMVVADLGSSNGTFVDGLRVRAPVVVEPLSTVTLGSTAIRLLGVAPLPGREPVGETSSSAPDPDPGAERLRLRQQTTNLSGVWRADATASPSRG